MLSYIGSEYGKNNSIRLVIVGMDHGDTMGGDYYERTRGIEDWYYVQGNAFNPHYKGVIRTAAAILGTMGEQCLNSCWQQGRCQGENRSLGSQCVLKCICQSNLVKCVSAPNRTSRSTNVMKRNCARHLLHELAELDPTIIVFHGVNAIWPFRQAVNEEPGATLQPVQDSPCRNREKILWVLTNQGQSSYVLFLSHPSHSWLDRRWDSEVLPAIELIVRNNPLDAI